MKRCGFLLMLSGLLCPVALSQVEIGNGGDAVFCVASPDNELNGVYILDYILKLRDGDLPQGSQVFARAADILGRSPRMADSFRQYKRDYEAYRQGLPATYYQWTPHSLRDINIQDEQIIAAIPPNCWENGRPHIRQAAVREYANDHVVIYYDPEIFRQLDEQQQSFLLVHEFFWLYSHSAGITRDANMLVHSTASTDMDGQSLDGALMTLGLNLHGFPRYIPHQVIIRAGLTSSLDHLIDFRPNAFTSNRLLIHNFTDVTLVLSAVGSPFSWPIESHQFYTFDVTVGVTAVIIRPFDDVPGVDPVTIDIRPAVE